MCFKLKSRRSKVTNIPENGKFMRSSLVKPEAIKIDLYNDCLWAGNLPVGWKSYDHSASGGSLPRLLPTCRTKFIAWCLKCPKREIQQSQIIYAPVIHEFRFVRCPHIKMTLCQILW